MIKVIYCITRKEGLTREEFQEYWLEQHGRSVVERAGSIGIVKYMQNHTIVNPLGVALAEPRGGAQPYDGVMEAWWESEESAMEALGTDNGRTALEFLFADEATFMDFSRSRIFMCREMVWELDDDR